MYIRYLRDRQKLGFSCIKDIDAGKQLFILTSKSKKVLILIFSKKALVAVLIFIKSSSVNVDPNLDRSSSSSPEVYQCSISRSDNLGFKESLKYITSFSSILDSILKLKGGYNELTDEEQEKLIKSLLAKVPQNSYQETSINKLVKRVLKIIEPVISNQKFWKILSASRKPIKSELSGPSEIRSTDILAPAENEKENQAKTGSKGSSIFVHGLVAPVSKKKHTLLPPMELNMVQTPTEDSFSNGLRPSGLSINHEILSENIQDIETKTRLRRAQPLYPSQVLGDSYQYGGKQLKRKALRHLEDFGISTEGKTVEQMNIEYKDLVEILLSKPNLVIREDGTLNKQEPTINIGDRESLGIVSFENNPLYEDHHFITSYPISPEAFEDFAQTGNIGKSPEEKAQKINELQKTRAQAEREKKTVRSFYTSLPEDAHIGNQQLREVKTIQEQLKEDPNFPLTEKEKNMIQRAEKHQQYKNKFYQNNPDIDRDEL